MLWAEIWKISEFLSENVQFLVVKFSIHLNSRVFVMTYISYVGLHEPQRTNYEVLKKANVHQSISAKKYAMNKLRRRQIGEIFFFFFFFFYFFKKMEYDISCKLPAKETICMKYLILFSEKKRKKSFSKCRLLKYLPRMLSGESVTSNPGWLIWSLRAQSTQYKSWLNTVSGHVYVHCYRGYLSTCHLEAFCQWHIH